MQTIRAEERNVRSFDGTGIAYRVAGGGLPILLVDGPGGCWKGWTHLVHYFLDSYRLIAWDYRGLYRSEQPLSARAFSVEDLARDGLAVLAGEKVERAVVFAWSGGVNVALQMFHHVPERIAALVLVSGGAGPSRVPLPFLGTQAWPDPFTLLPQVSAVTSRAARRALRWPETLTWARRIGLVGPSFDEELWQELATSFAGVNVENYLKIIGETRSHDARDVLSQVDVPTLVVSGDRDLFSSRRASEELVRSIPASEFLLVPGGSHFVLLEQPDLIALRVEKFLRERGYSSFRESAPGAPPR